MNADDFVVDLDGVDDRTQIGLSERGVAGGYVLAHESAEALDLIRLQRDLRRKLNLDALQCGLGALAFQFEGSEPVRQRLVDVREAILDQFVEPAQLVVGLRDLLLQDARPLLDFGVALCPLFGQRRQKARQTVWAEQPVGEMGCDKIVEPVHGDGSALAARLSHPGSCGAGIVAVHFAGF